RLSALRRLRGKRLQLPEPGEVQPSQLLHLHPAQRGGDAFPISGCSRYLTLQERDPTFTLLEQTDLLAERLQQPRRYSFFEAYLRQNIGRLADPILRLTDGLAGGLDAPGQLGEPLPVIRLKELHLRRKLLERVLSPTLRLGRASVCQGRLEQPRSLSGLHRLAEPFTQLGQLGLGVAHPGLRRPCLLQPLTRRFQPLTQHRGSRGAGAEAGCGARGREVVPTCRLARDRRGELLAVTLDQLGEHQSVAVPLLGRGELRWRRIPAFPLPSGTPTIQLRDPLVAVDLEGGEEGGVARRGR